jgi:hypothetical protein
MNVFIIQIDYMKISCKEDVHICHTNFTNEMEQNLHETTSRWKTYGKRLFSEDLEVRDVVPCYVSLQVFDNANFPGPLCMIGKVINSLDIHVLRINDTYHGSFC